MYRPWARQHRLRCLTSSPFANHAPHCWRRQSRGFHPTLLEQCRKSHSIELEPHKIHDFFQVCRLGDPYEDVLGHLSARLGWLGDSNLLVTNTRFIAEDLIALNSRGGHPSKEGKLSMIGKKIFAQAFEPLKDDFWGELASQEDYSIEVCIRDVLHTATSDMDTVRADLLKVENSSSFGLSIKKIELAARRAELIASAARYYITSLRGSNPPLFQTDSSVQERNKPSPGDLQLVTILLSLFETYLPVQPLERKAESYRPFQLSQRDVIRATKWTQDGLPHRPRLGMMYNLALEEAILSIRSDLARPAPWRNTRRFRHDKEGPPKGKDGQTELMDNRPANDTENETQYDKNEKLDGDEGSEMKKRPRLRDIDLPPITLLEFPQFSGHSAPICAVNDIGAALGADVVHITAESICRLLEFRNSDCDDIDNIDYDLNDGNEPMSMLRFKIAQNSGRMKTLQAENSGEDVKSHRKLSPSSSRGSPKVRKGLDLIRKFESQQLSGERRPILIHVHDFVAISMDELQGEPAIREIRAFVEELRLEGREAAVVATCSSARAQKSYHEQVVNLCNTQDGRYRLIRLQTAMLLICYKDKTSLKPLETRDTVEENMRNIHGVIKRLLSENMQHARPSEIELMPQPSLDEQLGGNVLSYAEVDRIARTAVGFYHAHWSSPSHQNNAVRNATSVGASIVESMRLLNQIKDIERRLNTARIQQQNNDAQKPPSNTAQMPEQRPNTEKSGSSRDEERLLTGLIKSKDIRTTFADIRAPKATIDSVRLLTELALKRPEEFSYGVLASERIRGLLLYGPPGTGKTLLAKAVAKESGANMLEVSAAAIYGRYVGESEKAVQSLFALAKRKDLAPLIIFIDEADAMLGSRDGKAITSSWRTSVTNQFLREMDGLQDNSAFVMMATNRPYDLDEALLRRLPRKLLIELPLEADREAILRLHLKGEQLDEAVSVKELAKRTPLYSGSDLKNVCVAAAMAAVKEALESSGREPTSPTGTPPKKRVLNQIHFDNALAQISASVSEDMQSLRALKKFDEKYGDAGAKRQRSMVGFGHVEDLGDASVPLVRR